MQITYLTEMDFTNYLCHRFIDEILEEWDEYGEGSYPVFIQRRFYEKSNEFFNKAVLN